MSTAVYSKWMKLIKLFYKKKYREKLYDNVSKDINAYIYEN